MKQGKKIKKKKQRTMKHDMNYSKFGFAHK